jgi:hypothetical protein
VNVDHDVEKYYSGDCYLSLYKRFKKEKFPVSLSDNHSDNADILEVDLDEILYILLFLEEREVTDVGLSNLIKAASDDLRKKSTVNSSDGELTKAMKEMGLDLETGESFMNPPQQNEPKSDKVKKPKKSTTKTKSQPQPVEKKPVEVEEDEENEICYKVVGDKLVVLIPEDTPVDTVDVNGIKFKRILTDIPDLNVSGLQVKKVLNDSEEQEEPEIKRVPIFLEKSEQSVEPDEEESNGESGDELSDLKRKKQELDAAIAEARKAGDTALVNDLRKQRRKVRNTINKMSEG